MRAQVLRPLAVGLLAALPSALAQDSVSFDYDSYGQNDPSGTPFQTFLSNSGVKPPQVQINSNRSGLAPGYVFIGVDGKPTSTQNFPTILDMSAERMGTLIWTGNYTEPFDFRTQPYKGQPVLTFWAGELLNGYGHGSFYILNQSYVEIAHFSPVGFQDLGDIHEFTITSEDTALVGIYHAVQMDLSSVQGASDGWILENTFQEINIETGELIFQWNASTHVGLNESYNSITDVGTESAPWDYFHINSVEKDANGDYLVSARVMDCVYKISGDDGHIIWRLQGKQSDFDVEDAATFAFQHDARWVDDKQTRMTLFDNGPTENIGYSRGLVLAVDQNAKTVRLVRNFSNGAKTFAQFEGDVQAINPEDQDTNYFVGYGSQPFFSEFDSEGNILLDAQFGKTNTVNSYRAYKLPWQGKPLTKPDIYYDRDGNKTYFSWNGATDVEEWIVYTANATNSRTWTNVTSARRTGFETTIDLANMEVETYIRGKAVNSTGSTLGWTRAGDGNEFFDVSDDVEENTSSPRPRPTTTTSSTSSSSGVTSAAPSSSKTAAAVRSSHGLVDQVYIIAVVVVGGLVVT